MPDDGDMIFSLDEDHLENNATSDNAIRTCIGNPINLSTASVQKPRPRSPLRLKSFTTHRRKHVRIFFLEYTLNIYIFEFDTSIIKCFLIIQYFFLPEIIY